MAAELSCRIDLKEKQFGINSFVVSSFAESVFIIINLTFNEFILIKILS